MPWATNDIDGHEWTLQVRSWLELTVMDRKLQEAPGDVVRALLDERGLVHGEFARKINATPSAFSKWLAGTRVPSWEAQEAIDKALDLDLSGKWTARSGPKRLFVSAPGEGLRPKDRSEHRQKVEKVVTAIKNQVDVVHWPGSNVLGPEDLGAPGPATKRSLELLNESQALVYLQFSEMVRPTSSLVELGIALGRKMRVTVFIQEGLHQPFMMSNFDGVAARLPFMPDARTYEVKSPDQVVRWIKKDGAHLLGFKRE